MRKALILLAVVALVIVVAGAFNNGVAFDIDYVAGTASSVSLFWVSLVIAAIVFVAGLAAAWFALAGAAGGRRKLEAELQSTYERLRETERGAEEARSAAAASAAAAAATLAATPEATVVAEREEATLVADGPTVLDAEGPTVVDAEGQTVVAGEAPAESSADERAGEQTEITTAQAAGAGAGQAPEESAAHEAAVDDARQQDADADDAGARE